MKIAVIGAGLMGSGIAQTCAQAGYEVKNIDVFEPAIEKAKENIEKIFVKKIAKGKITEAEKAEVLERLTYSSHMEEYHCFAESLHEVCVQATLNSKTRCDIRQKPNCV